MSEAPFSIHVEINGDITTALDHVFGRLEQALGPLQINGPIRMTVEGAQKAHADHTGPPAMQRPRRKL